MIPQSLKQLTKEYATRKRLGEFKTLMGILPDPNKILEENNYDYSIFRDLMTDPQLTAVMQQRKMQVLQMNMKLIGDEKQKERAKEVIEKLPKEKIINESLDALFYGFSPMEIDYELEGNELVIRNISEKPQEWFMFDEKNELYMRKKEGSGFIFEKGMKLPQYKFVVVRNQPSYTNPYGEKLLTNVYWSVTFKRAAVENWQDRIEKYGLPFVEGEYPSGITPAEIDAYEEKIEEMLETNMLIKEAGYELTFREPPKYDLGKNFEVIIDYHNQEISKAILSETLTISVQDSGSYALADIHREMLSILGTADKKLPELVINKILEFDMLLNFGENEAAKVKLIKTEDAEKQQTNLEIIDEM